MPDSADGGADWAHVLTSRLETLVAAIRDHSVRPAYGILRIVVIAATAAVIGLAILVLLLLGLVRLFDTSLFAGHVWITDFLFGGILLGGGVFLLRLGGRTNE